MLGRDELIQQALESADLDLLVCSLPVNVLLLSGYWPVMGSSLAMASRDGLILLVVPRDEDDLAELSWADEVETFEPFSLLRITSPMEAMQRAIEKVTQALGAFPKRIGFESGRAYEPAPYPALHLFGGTVQDALGHVFPGSSQVSADELLTELRTIKTPGETEHIRTACDVAERGFKEGSARIRTGLTELETAALFRIPLSTCNHQSRTDRCDGFVFCMSGENGSRAYGAYARSRRRVLKRGDLAVLQCVSYVDGYWADITRTYCIGTPDDRQKKLYDTIFAAREAALAAVRPGGKASEVDKAARDVISSAGFAENFRHPTGHGVGFAALNHYARPRLHPKSIEILKPGMIFTLEPGLYFEDCGIRHGDMVLVTEAGMEILTPFQAKLEDLCIEV
jgi:Xaa-Pro aminopeptidase